MEITCRDREFVDLLEQRKIHRNQMARTRRGPLFIYSRPEDRFTELDARALPLGILPSFASDLRHVSGFMPVIWCSWPRTIFSNGRTIRANNLECSDWKR
jgi:hypothetical protein